MENVLLLIKMEILQLSLPFLFTFILFVFMIIKNRKVSKLKLPPGPQKLPFIGNLHQLNGSLPHRSLNDLAKKHGPIMHLQLGEMSNLIISSAEGAKEVMKNQDLIFADRPLTSSVKLTSYNGCDVAFAPYGEYWRQIRKICTLELTSSKRVQSYRSLREEEVTNLLKSISSSTGEPINLGKMILSYMNNVTCRAAFGTKCHQKDEFLLATKEMIRSLGGFDVADLFPSYTFLHRISSVKADLEKVHSRVDAILEKIIVDHQEKKKSGISSTEDFGAENLLDVLLKLQESSEFEFPIATKNIKGVIQDIFAAGTETSAVAIEWAISELIRNPHIMKKVQTEVRQVLNGKTKIDETDIRDMNYLKLVIKETLRLHPSLPLLLPRESREKCKINDYDIPIKTRVIINAWAIGRDPDYWENPECFNPDRFSDSTVDFKGTSFEFIPFGSGRRMCAGISLGIANIELPLAQLLYHFDWKLPNGTKPEEFDMTESFGATVTRKNDLILVGIPYYP